MEETLPVLEAFLAAEEAAKNFGMGVYERMQTEGLAVNDVPEVIADYITRNHTNCEECC